MSFSKSNELDVGMKGKKEERKGGRKEEKGEEKMRGSQRGVKEAYLPKFQVI
jgi:hypothetical protein